MNKPGPKTNRFSEIAAAWGTGPKTICDWDGRFRRCGIVANWDDPASIRDHLPTLREAGEARRMVAPRWMLIKFADLPRSERPPEVELEPSESTDEPVEEIAISADLNFQQVIVAADRNFKRIDQQMARAQDAQNWARVEQLMKPWQLSADILRKVQADGGKIMDRQQATLDKDAVRTYLLEIHGGIRKALKIQAVKALTALLQENPSPVPAEIGRLVDELVERVTVGLNETELAL